MKKLSPQEPSERRVSEARLYHAVLQSLLATLNEPVLVFHDEGSVELANEAGLQWLQAARDRDQLEPLREALASGAPHPEFTVIRLARSGCPGYSLVLFGGRRASSTDAVVRATRAWKLSPRLSGVLEQVASGRSNKEIAAALSCAEVTIEKRLTQIFRISRTRSRAELVAKLHDVPWEKESP